MNEAIEQLMRRSIFVVEASSPLSDAVDMLHSYPIDYLPVVADGGFVGMINKEDLIRLNLGKSFGSEKDKENAAFFEIVKVEDVMLRQQGVVHPSDPISVVTERFANEQVHALPVADEKGLVGIITQSDIIKYQQEKLEHTQVPEKYIEQRPWGGFEQFCQNTPCTVKILNVNPDEELSLQYHEHRNEFWRVIEGEGIVVIGNDERSAEKGDEFIIPIRTNHQIKTIFSPMRILEISFGHFDEKDIVRIQDKYNRIGEQADT